MRSRDTNAARQNLGTSNRTSGRRNRAGLLCGVSALALVMTGAPVRALQLSSMRGGSGSATAQVAAAALASAQQSAAVTQQTMSALLRANQAVQAMQQAQAAARAAAANAASAGAGLPAVPNGLAAGGLQVAPGATAGSSLWQNASAPTQSVSNGQTSVNINQQAAQAILTWQTFNVGKETTLNFNQQGNSNWVVLNRVIDPSGLPSQILGQINATGQVYVINHNGIVFGGASQINVGTLIASTADFNPNVVAGTDGSASAGADAYFLTDGIYSNESSGSYAPSFTNAGGAVTVEPGAQITTNTPAAVTSGGGFVLLMGTQVNNAGTITTPDGQTELAAGDSFLIRPGYSTSGNSWSTTRGNEIAVELNNLGSSLTSGSGVVTNNGIIEADTGDITLAGETVTQNGVAISTTSVNTRGTIHLLSSASDPQSSVTLTGSSVSEIVPDTSGATALNSQRSALLTDSTTQDTNRLDNTNSQFDDLSTLADLEDESRVEIVSGGKVWFQNNSQTVATGGQISVSAVNRVQVDTGALLDVAGDQTTLAMSANDIAVEVQGNELRDDPNNRDTSVLFDDTVYVDERQLTFVPASSADSSDRDYTAGGVFEVSGWLNTTAHTIGEWLASGGQITLSTGSSGAVVAQTGAEFNIAGGQIQYQSGFVKQSYLIGSDGNLYNANTAPSELTYTGIYDGFTVDHAHWGVTQFFGTSLFAPSQIYEPGYTVGRDAGSLTLSTPTTIFDATVDAGVIDGQDQDTARPATVTDSYLLSQTTVPLQGSIALGEYNSLGLIGGYTTNVSFGASSDTDTSAPSASDPISSADAGTANFDAGQISSENLGGLSVATSGSIAVKAPLTFAPGAHVSFLAPDTDIAANITAPSGSVSITNLFQVDDETTLVPTVLTDTNELAQATIEQGVTLDTSGQWTNALSDPFDLTGLAFVNGGSVSIDMSQGVTLSSGSLLNVSSGGGILVSGKTQGGVGGSITLIADDGRGGGSATAPLILDGDVQGYGVNGGGTLTIASNQSIIFADQAMLADGVLPAGEAAPVSLVLAASITVPAGARAAASFQETFTTDAAGQSLPVSVTPTFADNGVGLLVSPTSQGWVVPSTISNVSTADGNSYSAGQTVPAGELIIGGSGTLPYGYQVPANVFPNGIAINAATLTEPAGALLTQPQTLAAGSVISAGAILAQPVSVVAPLNLNPDLLSRGFSAYDISSNLSVGVAPGTQLKVTEPVYQFTTASSAAPTGADPASALQIWLPPLYLQNPITAQLTPRAGASLSLTAGTAFNNSNGSSTADIIFGGNLDVGAGAAIDVDPGQSISLDASGQMTIDGTLRARGGSISITNTTLNDDSALGQSIWIGGDAVLDVSGEASTATDIAGRPYGTVTPGGSIVLGYAGDAQNSQTGVINSNYDFIVVQAGAVLDASGASAVIDPAAGTASSRLSHRVASAPVLVATDGGSITLSSYTGIYVDGTMQAAAGGSGALGGTLAVTLETPGYGNGADTTNPDFVPRVITIGQSALAPQLPADLQPGASDPSLVFGQAQFSADTLEADGFANLSFLARDAVVFNGNVNLTAGQSITFREGAIADTSTSGQVTITAPYVLFDGYNGVDTNFLGAYPTLFEDDNWQSSTQQSTGTFTVNADLIDIADEVVFGIDAPGSSNGGGLTSTVDYAGFAAVNFTSQGDIRFTAGQTTTPSLFTSGNLTFTSAQLYPTTGVDAEVVAGVSGQAPNIDSSGIITFRRINDVTPQQPDSVSGVINLAAATIEQGGIIRAPLGTINLGLINGTVLSDEIELLPGSITSVSANGLDIPYGGTTDGVTYTYDGETVSTIVVNTAETPNTINNPANPYLVIAGQSVTVDKGATLDLSGGGTLAGAGFIEGEGGSVNILSTPLVNANPTNTFSSAGNGVYAIVAGYRGAYAPAQAGEGALPGIGQQITIPSGVPGLPAGTYTLLPAYYALLPGGYRVELGKAATGTSLVANAAQAGNGNYIVDGYQGIANTGARSALATQLIVTPGSAVRDDSQFDEEDWGTFAQQSATTLDQVRPVLPVDAGTLVFQYSGQTNNLPPLTFEGTALLQPASSGLTGTVIITGGSDIEITAGAPTPGFTGYSFNVADLDAIDAPNLIIGGSDIGYFSGGLVRPDTIQASASSLTIRDGADLTAGQVLLLAGSGGITLESGAEVDTIGKGAVNSNIAPDDIYQISNVGDNTLLAVSNDPNLTFVDSAPSNGSITINAGAQIYSEGTIALVTGGAVSIDPNAHYGTRNLSLSVGSINIGTDASLDRAVAPSGLLLTQDLLDSLFAGDTSVGAPALQTLTLVASQSVNFYGSVDLDVIDPATGKADLNLVLDTAAIYGYGGAGDTATLTVGTLTWGGIAGVLTGNVAPSLPPGPITSGGPGTGAGTLDINAGQIVFGFPANVAPNNQTTFDRIMYGFSSVNLAATQQISSSGQNSLTLYQAQGNDPSGPGTGGNLNLDTPLLTGGAGSVMSFTAGGTLDVAPAGVAARDETIGALGGEITLNADTIAVSSTILLPSGELTLNATNDINLQAGSTLALTGQATTLIDQTEYSWGGDVSLLSASGNIIQSTGSTIDVSAENNNAGSITAQAIGTGAGQVALDGSLLGDATVTPGANIAPQGGAITVDAQTLTSGTAPGLSADFAALNNALNASGFFWSRSFDLKQGDLTIGNELQAHEISVSVDNGNLTVAGTINASGATPGSITLAAMNDLTLSGTLDAHGTVLQVDSYGYPIDAENQGKANLTAVNGELTLNSGSSIDVNVIDPRNVDSSGNQIVNYGDIELNAPRTGTEGTSATGAGAPTNATGTGIDISASGVINIKGAASVAVNGFATYTNAPANAFGQTIDQGYFDEINSDSQEFISAAGSNTQSALSGLTSYKITASGTSSTTNTISTGNLSFTTTAGLGFAAGQSVTITNTGNTSDTMRGTVVSYNSASGVLDVDITATNGNGSNSSWAIAAQQSAFHLRPGVEIESATANGDLTVAGDIDLSGYRYSDPSNYGLQVNSAVYGSGEPGSLIIRAGGNLDIVGSINDGFYPGPINPETGTAVPTPDDKDWVITGGSQANATETLLQVTLETGTTIPDTPGLTLRYNIDIQGATINANTVIPLQVTLSDDYTIPANTRLTAAIYDSTGKQIYAAGALITNATTLPAGTQLGPGTVMPGTVDITAMTWKAGTSLGIFTGAVTLSDNATVPIEGIIPAGANLVLQNNYAMTRAYNSSGTQGTNFAVAPMLPPGDLSSSIKLVSGADLKAADPDIVQPASALKAAGVSGNLTLTDSHQTTTIENGYFFHNYSGEHAVGGPEGFYCYIYSCSVGQVAVTGATVPSVVRTGTGNLDLIAGGSFNEASLFGVYTAGTQSADVGEVADDSFNEPLGSGSNTVASFGDSGLESAVQDYQANYPTNGGNLFINVQGNLIGDLPGNGSGVAGNWLWRQGAGATAGVDQPTAWWINFGTYTIAQTFNGPVPTVTAFTGLGTLGGGNVTLNVGGNAGTGTSPTSISTGLNVAIGSTGRVSSNGTIEETGGGNLTVEIGGDLNDYTGTSGTPDGGAFTDLRGNISIQASAIGTIIPAYGMPAVITDPRTISPTTAESAAAFGGIVVVPGDGAVTISTSGDLVFSGVGDATREGQPNSAPFELDGTVTQGATEGFSLWTDATAINLFSAGGNLVPSTSVQITDFNGLSADNHLFYPSTLNVIAASGSIYFENQSNAFGFVPAPVELMPSATGELNLLAQGSIINALIDISGADPSSIATPTHAAFFDSVFDPDTGITTNYTDVSPNTYEGQQSTDQLLPFGPDTPTTNLHADDADPAHIYAVTGDIVNMQFGEVLTFNPQSTTVTTTTWYVGAKPADIIAGGDIVISGLPYSSDTGASSVSGSITNPGFILNDNPTDISVMSAGKNIIYSSLQVAGPGLLEVTVGGNIYEANQGAFQSIGPVFDINASDRSSGADITVMAGLGANGPDYAAFANAYLNPTDPSALLSGLSDYSTIVQQNDAELASWLAQNFGYQGGTSGAYAYFQTLPAAQQDVFVRQVFFEQLNAGGLDFNDASSIHFKSYIIGQDAIATLFPTQDAQGNPINYAGNITLFGNSGIHTLSGGAIQTFTPGGQTIVGVEGATPLGSAGLLTEGSGDIDMYSEGSILLGESRILTTFGGNIVAWSATGDINSGKGSKTTVVFTPPIVAYDNYGNVTLSPQTPSTGAGIGTLNPIPSIPPGNVNLITPLGTVDAGEAGIRVSGNFNVAALHVVNVANIQVQGSTTGVPTVIAPNIGALNDASGASGAATKAVTASAGSSRAALQPSILIVEIEGYGGDDGSAPAPTPQQDQKRKKRDIHASEDDIYDPNSTFRVIGSGTLSDEQKNVLTDQEKGNL